MHNDCLVHLRCRKCNAQLSKFITKSPNLRSVWADHTKIKLDFNAEGSYTQEENGDYILHLKDGKNLNHHPDSRRFIGCCGPSPDGLPNLICRCKAEIGRETYDCIFPHYIRIDHKMVKLVEDKWKIFAALQKLGNDKEHEAKIAMFFQLSYYASDAEIQAFLRENFAVGRG